MPDKVEDEKTGKIMPMYKRAQLDALINGYTVGWDKVDIHKLKSDYSEYLSKLNAPPPKPKETKRWGKIEIPEYHPEYEEEKFVPYKKPEYPKDDVTNSDLDWNNENDMESISKQLEKQYQTENTKYKMKRKIVLTESDLHRVIKESVQQVLCEYLKPTRMSYSEALRHLRPDDGIDVEFPKGFMLSYNAGGIHDKKIREFECSRLSVYFWPESDHWGKSYYYYEPNKTSWTTKSLTPESEQKVKEYLDTHECIYDILY